MTVIDLSQFTCTKNREALQCLYDVLAACPCDGIDPIGPDGLPEADFEADPLDGCSPLEVQFIDLSTTVTGNITSWLWDFGDGDTSTDQNPLHEYLLSGLYTVTLTVGNGSGFDTEIKVDYVEVVDPVIAEFSGTPTSGAFPLEVQFTDLSTGTPTSWSWDFGDGGISNLQNPLYEYLIEGTYTVTLIASNDYCDDTETKVDYIAPDPELLLNNEPVNLQKKTKKKSKTSDGENK